MASTSAKKQKKREKYSLEELKTLGHQLLSSRAHINNLPLLLSVISSSSRPQNVLEALLSVQSFFIPVLPELPPSAKSLIDGNVEESKKDPELIYRTWLRSKFDEFVKLLITVVVSSQCEEALRDIALDAVMEFVRLGKGGRFQSVIYQKLIHTIVHSTLPDDLLLNLLPSKFFKFIDVRYFTCISLEKIVRSLETVDTTNDDRNVSLRDNGGDISKSGNIELSIRKIYYILAQIPPLEGQDGKSDYEMWSQLGFSSKEEDRQPKSKKTNNGVLSTSSITKKMKLKFTKAWMSFLRLPLPVDVYKEVLVTLHQAVIPHLSNPVMLCDFLTRSYDIGGGVSVMALSSLYILMTQHGLEYPNFYQKLYALLLPSIFMAKHRAKFFELLDACLKSPLLPAYLAAAFAKKLSRLALLVPPSGALVIIALIHNLLRRHPSINCLVHWLEGDENDREVSSEAGDFGKSKDGIGHDASCKRPGVDPFNIEENDPAKSNAMKSSLWEIDTLRHHYCPAVSRFVLSLETDLTVRAKTTEVAVKDFSSGSYATIFRSEIGRRVKQVPLAFYKATPTSLFSESEFAGWTFKDSEKREKENDDNPILNTPSEGNKSAKRPRTEC
ncbi:PREDICTED: nucleolar complex protein 4 homolog isoform X1 [Nelumbo nucifera]|uniref:Nucleolar complex protein 4 homolog isoform X1 n=1 Tax=Nelumbo nucifera TaxID=4432 RepID=A0A1U8AF77_NELNU|nr:PREDICTED: nucleolar complex protein 4 homolog isoform X1 [Nelumbo nucifera]